MQALSNIRVLEIGEMVAAPYAAKLLADLGAEVIKIEPPGGDAARRCGPFPEGHAGDAERSGLFLGLNNNKTSVVLDLGVNADRARLLELVGQADILFHDRGAAEAAEIGLDAALLEQHPAMVICALTPFGHTGPHADWLGHEINIVHGGGWGYMIPGDAPDLSTPPLTVFGHPATCQAAMAGAFAALGAYYKAQATGCGEFIDLSTMAHVSSMLESSFVAWSYADKVAMRAEGRLLNPWGIYQCSDGLIFMVTVEQDQWERLVDMMGRPEWATLDVFATIADRSANRDVLNLYLNEWTSQHTVESLFHRGQAERICFAPVFTMADLHEQDHLHARGFFVDAAHPVAGSATYMGAPYRMTPDSWQLQSTAPTLDPTASPSFSKRATTSDTARPTGETVRQHGDTVRQRPLEGVRVIDFSWVWAGPFCTMHLAHLGAEVIKIESSTRPSLGRRLPIHPVDVQPTLNTCGYFNQWDQGKKSIELNLSDPASIDTALALVASADIVVDNYATGVMDRLGLDDETLRAANPNIILASITGFGHSGPLSEYMGYGPTTAPLSGLTSMTGHVGGRPEEAGISFGDPAAGLTAAFAIVASLLKRERSGEPTRIDVSLWEATAANAIELWMAHAVGAPTLERMGNRSPWAAPHGVFRCLGDDDWISIACATNGQWAALCSLLGLEATDRRFATIESRKANEDELEAILERFTVERDRWELTEQLQHVGVPAYPSLSCPEIETNAQLIARDFWERFDHPEVGARTQSGVPWRMHNSANGVMHRAPLLGEHSADILRSLS